MGYVGLEPDLEKKLARPVRRHVPTSAFRAAVLVFITVLFFWIIRGSSSNGHSASDSRVKRVNQVAVSSPQANRVGTRIAIITFTTKQLSYTYLSLKNKACMLKNSPRTNSGILT